MPILNIFYIIGMVALVIGFIGKNAIWGTATIGLIVGLIVGVFTGDFSNIIRAALLGADVGLFFTILPFIFNSFLKK